MPENTGLIPLISSLTVPAEDLTPEQCARIAEWLHAQGVVKVMFEKGTHPVKVMVSFRRKVGLATNPAESEEET
jgi:hypothetical protein